MWDAVKKRINNSASFYKQLKLRRKEMTKMIGKLFCAAAMLGILMSGVLFAEESAKININSASVQELTQLDKVGEKYAERIVAYRNENGMFKTPEDIMKVQGIGPKVWELNKDRIIVGDTAEKASQSPKQ